MIIIKESSGKKNKKGKDEEDEDSVMIVDDSDLSDREKEKEKKKEKKSGSKRKKISSNSEEEEEIIVKKSKKSRESKAKKTHVIESESDEDIAVKPKHEGRGRKKHKKQPVTLDSDSDDESRDRSPDVDPIKAAFQRQAQKAPTPKKSTPTKSTEEKKKQISVSDFFGGGSVKKSERKTAALKRKAPDGDTPSMDKEEHDDVDFQRTLELLDEQQAKKTKIESTKVTPSKSSQSRRHDSTPSKSITVAETPVRESPRRSSRTTTPQKEESRSSSRTPRKEESRSSSKTPQKQTLTSDQTPQKSRSSSKGRSRSEVSVVEETPERSSPRTRSRSRSCTPAKSDTSSEPSVRQSPRRKENECKTEGSSLAKKLAAKARSRELLNTKEEEEKELKKSTPQKKTPSKAKTPVKATPEKTESSPGTPATLERKGSSYKSYLTRAGPSSLGAKEVPEGGDNCLEGLTFVITGVLESFERDDMKSAIEKYGGKVTGSISKRTSYVVVGRDAGESKLSKARQLGTKQLDEDGVLDLIKTLPGKKSKYTVAAEKMVREDSLSKSAVNEASGKKASLKKEASVTTPGKASHSESTPTKPGQSEAKIGVDKPGESLLWVDKYKPTSMKQLIGQQGDKSNAKKLFHWLNNWHKNIASGKKPVFSRFDSDGAGYRAALLSGPPGVGKTSAATVVCQEAGFSYIELNASDTRNKKSLEQEVAEALSNHTLVDFFGSGQSSSSGQKHCLIMDEVDGMAGNEDRGGVQELVQLLKKTKIPIICMCNDRNHPKIRTLANYCFDLRFYKPRLEQIKGPMLSLCFKEKIKVPPPALNEIIAGANHDIRQIIHNLAMWSASDKSLTYEQAKSDANQAKKDMKIGPFDICRKVLVGGAETAGMTLADKQDLFFQDYDLTPLFVHENYLSTTPQAAQGNMKKHLRLISQAVDSMCDGDMVSKVIRGQQRWSLLTSQSIFSSVIPGDLMRGSLPQMVSFPSWLGKNSSKNKVDRILQELRTHMCLKVSANKEGLAMDYLPHLRSSLTQPLVQGDADGVPDVIHMMDEYSLLREDFDNILEVTQWSGRKDPMASVPSKVKSAFTRAYNKEAHMTPYAVSNMGKKGKKSVSSAEDYPGLGEEEDGEIGGGGGGEDEEEEEEVTADAMIKVKKPPAAKGKGKGEGKGQGKGKGRGKKS
ncbi:replication factor C subunit 1 [Lingula anatina]|uniref:Replication factor C subunit 1 n=1 Tax=Lingula anatina TaxID=7574 RepID=A0A1S3J3S5_LINAN|nr:replication factor C subunit 1 [Lingula anatina]|eukprot:XP_013404916.1 replication factor C subunit 1 [Lingula anatina]